MVAWATLCRHLLHKVRAELRARSKTDEMPRPGALWFDLVPWARYELREINKTYPGGADKAPLQTL